jgi:hypothetical protein
MTRGAHPHRGTAGRGTSRQAFARNSVEKKTCRHCGETKAASDFPRNQRVSDGLSSWCRLCHNAASAEWRAEHSEEISAYHRRRYRERVEANARAVESMRQEHLRRLREQTGARRRSMPP